MSIVLTALIDFACGPLFHAITHVAVHGAAEGVERYVHRPDRLLNHDIEKVLRRSLEASVKRLRADYQREQPDDKKASEVFNALARIRMGNAIDSEHQEPHSWLSAEEVRTRMGELVDSISSDAPEVRAFLIERFPGMFAFAFREIGLKRNEQVRAVILGSMLRHVMDNQEVIKQQVLESRDAMNAGLERIGLSQPSTTSVDALLKEIQDLNNWISTQGLGDGPVLAHLRIADGAGNNLRTVDIRKRTIRIGRAADNSVQLDDRHVSRIHAEITLDGTHFIVEDRKSANGTFIGERRLETREVCELGTPIRIRPYVLSVLAIGAPAEELLDRSTKIFRP